MTVATLALLQANLLMWFPAMPALAQDAASQDTFAGRLNTTGRTIHLPVPFKDGDRVLGEVNLRIDASDRISVPKLQLADLLKKTIDASELERLHGFGGDVADVVIEDLRDAGFNFWFDENLLELNFAPGHAQRAVTDLSLAGRAQVVGSSVAVPSAAVSGYLNVLAGVDHVWDTSPGATGNGNTGLRFDLQAVLRAGGLVLESDAAYEGAVDSSCPDDAFCVYYREKGFKRRATRLVYDRPEDRVRVQIGDTDTLATAFQNSPSLLGLSVEKSNRKLAPGENVRPTGSRSFQIVRPSDVDVIVNGSVLRHFSLRPGGYNLKDLPLGVGANEVELVITDDTGSRQSLRFTQFFDQNLIAQGQSEWAVAGGITSALVDSARSYQDGDYLGTGFFRVGITDETTGEAHIQADARVLMGGLGVFRATPWGAIGLEGAASTSGSGIGLAATASWSLGNFEGPISALTRLPESAYLTATYQSSEFRTPGEYLITASGILYPQYPYWLRASANYVTSLMPGVAATLSARYQLAADDPLILSPYTFDSDRYSADLTLSASLGGAKTASVSLGYSNEYLVQDPVPSDIRKSGDFRIAARVYLRPDDATYISTTYDSLNDAITIRANRDVGRGIGRWATSIDVHRSGYDDRGTANGTITYYGNRAEVRASHRAGMYGFDWSDFKPNIDEHRTTARVGTAVAFADGKIAVGAPIRGDAFAIVHAHESLADKDIYVLDGDDVRARADQWGPALVSQLPAYTDVTLPIDVEDLPIGYSLGAGAFDLRPAYKSGQVLEVGSDNSVTVYGTLLGQDNTAVAFVMGEAYREDNPRRRIAFFTNASGKFAAEGLAPGEWTLEVETEGEPTNFRLVVPEDAEGLLRTGILTPVGRW